MSEHKSTPKDIGIFHLVRETWHPFGYDCPRLAKPHPCFTDANDHLFEIWRELLKTDRKWCIRPASKAERDNPRIDQ